MAKFELKSKALELRKKGWSIGSIARKIHISKSTASTWCREMKLSYRQKELLRTNAIKAGHKGRMIGAEMNRNKRIQVQFEMRNNAKLFMGSLSRRDIDMFGIGLYWAEGHKTGNTLGIVNSNPSIIILAMQWLKNQFNLTEKDYMPRLFINENHHSREKEIIDFWSNITKIPKSSFRNTIFIKSKQVKIYENRDTYFGVMHLRVQKSSRLLYQVLAEIELVKEYLRGD